MREFMRVTDLVEKKWKRIDWSDFDDTPKEETTSRYVEVNSIGKTGKRYVKEVEKVVKKDTKACG